MNEELSMRRLEVKPGDTLVSEFGGYQHWSLVTDQVCEKGMPMLISATKRNNTVQEESWDKVTQGKHSYVAQVETNKPVEQILCDARSQIGKWRYSLTKQNCEHFVKWAAGLEVSSRQITAGTTGAVVGAGAVAVLSENPKWFWFLGGAMLVGGLAIAITKATEKE